jgi:hypothetical protein
MARVRRAPQSVRIWDVATGKVRDAVAHERARSGIPTHVPHAGLLAGHGLSDT